MVYVALFGCTMLTEQAGPRELVPHAVGAERAGSDFTVFSDHTFPRPESQGHVPYAWSVLDAAAQATSTLPLMTFVTCPTFPYHPAVIAQKAATTHMLSRGRFRLGLGSGENVNENLNEHIVGAGWPTAPVRLEMLEEAFGIIRSLLAGDTVSHGGVHFDVDNAKLWDLPEDPPRIGIAVSGELSCGIAGRYGDLVIATEPRRELLEAFDTHRGAGKPRIGRLPVCYDPDRDAAIARAHDRFRQSVGGWKVKAELPGPAGFEQAGTHIRPEDVADVIPSGADVHAFVEAVRPFRDAGFTEIALVQVGGDQQEPFLCWAQAELLPALREL